MSFNSDKRDRRDSLKWGLWLGLIAVPVVGLSIFVGEAVLSGLSAPARVVTKTLGTDNIIHNYEWFRDTSQAYTARVSQIASHKRAMGSVPAADSQELSRYRVEIEGMRQSCRDMAAKYNANAAKMNRNIFMGSGVPDGLSISNCDA